jgi:hypothetical protein
MNDIDQLLLYNLFFSWLSAIPNRAFFNQRADIVLQYHTNTHQDYGPA